MDLKQKLATAKEKLKEDRRVIAYCAFTAAIAVAYYETKYKNSLLLTKEDRNLVKTKDVNMRYSVNGDDYDLRYLGKTPKKN